MPIHNSDGTLTEDRSIVVYDPSKNRHVPAGHVWDASLNKFVPSGEPVKLPASMIPLSTETGNALRLSQADGNLYVAPTAVINVADDQGLTASETDSARVTVSSTTVDTLVNGVQETTVNHDFHVDVKVAATPASGIANALSTHADGLYVAKEILGEDVPPSTASDGGVSATIYGGLNATMGDPSGWLQLSVPQADGSIWLFKVPHYGKTVVPAGQNVFTYKPTTEGGGGEAPPPPPPDEIVVEVPPPTPTEYMGVYEYQTAVAALSSAQVTEFTTSGLLAAYNSYLDAVQTGTTTNAANEFEFAQALATRFGTNAGNIESYFKFLAAIGFRSGQADMTAIAQTLDGTLVGAIGANKVKIAINGVDNYMVITPGSTLKEVILNGAFTFTPNVANASLVDGNTTAAITAFYSYAAYRKVFNQFTWATGLNGNYGQISVV